MIVLLTGGSRGIGKGIKEIFENQNHTVISPSKLEMDLSDIESVKSYLNTMIVGIPSEILVNESRVAATPQTVKRLLKQGFSVVIQSKAGEKADFSDIQFHKNSIGSVRRK